MTKNTWNGVRLLRWFSKCSSILQVVKAALEEKVLKNDEVKIIIENAYNEAQEAQYDDYCPCPTFFSIFLSILVVFLIFGAMVFEYIKRTYGDALYNIAWNLFWNDMGFFATMGAAAILYYAKIAGYGLLVVYAVILFSLLVREIVMFCWRSATTCRYTPSWDKFERPYEVKVSNV